jgi:hypothetical protein
MVSKISAMLIVLRESGFRAAGEARRGGLQCTRPGPSAHAWRGREQLLARGRRDRDHGRMLEPALDGDRVEALHHPRDLADDLHPVLPADLVLHHAGRREHPHPRLPEGLQQAAVRDLRHHPRPDALRLQPLVQRAAERGVPGGEQERRGLQRAGEAAPIPRGERRRGEDRDAALAQQVVVGADAHGGRQRRVGENQVEAVHGELGEQAVGAVVLEDQADRLVQPQGGLQQPVGHQLGKGVHDADRQAQGLAGGAGLEGVGELAAQREDLVGVFVRELARPGGHQGAAALLQELLAQGVLQLLELRAYGRLRHVQPLAGAGDAALSHHGVEVQQVPVVEHGSPVSAGGSPSPPEP